jgi:hypothetical protein
MDQSMEYEPQEEKAQPELKLEPASLASPPGKRAKTDDFMQQIRELMGFYKEGLLTEEEFTKAKGKLLQLNQ